MADYIKKAKDVVDSVSDKVSSAVDSAKSTAKGLGDFAFGNKAMEKVTGESKPFFGGMSKGNSISTEKPDPDARKKADAGMRKMYPKSASKGATK